MFMFSPKFLYWSLISGVLVFEGVIFGRWLGHEDGGLMNGIRAPIKEVLVIYIAPCTTKKSKETFICEPGSGSWPKTQSARALILAARLWEINLCL